MKKKSCVLSSGLGRSLIFMVFCFGITGAQGQEGTLSDARIKAARAAVRTLHATDTFDNFLPAAAQDVKTQFMSRDPNLSQTISNLVDKEALTLAAQRTQLEEEVAQAYATEFTQEELQKITEFYESPVGKAFLEKGPKVLRKSFGLFQDWSKKIIDTLAAKVTEDLKNSKEVSAK